MKEIAKALIKFHSLMPVVKKDADNPFFKSKYAPLESILPAIKEPLERSGLTFVQIPTGEGELKTIIIHAESGETIEGTYRMTPSKNDPQGQGAAITYMRRFALVSMLGLNTDEDDDGNLASKKPSLKTMATKVVKEGYQAALDTVEKATTAEMLLAIGDKVDISTVLTEEEKKVLRLKINGKLDLIDPTQ